MKVRMKKLNPDAIIPRYTKPGDADMDLTAVWMNQQMEIITYGTGLAVEIPAGHVGLLSGHQYIKLKCHLPTQLGL